MKLMYVCLPSPQVFKKIVLGILAIACLGIFVQYLTTRSTVSYLERNFLSQHMKRFYKKQPPIVSSVCHPPDYDPFDPTILKYYENFTLKCSDEPYLTIMDENGYIYLNESGFKAANKSSDTVECKYYTIEAIEEEEYKLNYGPSKIITAKPTLSGAEFVGVSCEEFNKTIYQKVHFYLPLPSKIKQLRNSRLHEAGRPNVLLLQIDSMSRLNFVRNLPKSYEFLVERLGAVVMKGMNKVGLNTHPNMFPFLTGLKAASGEDPYFTTWTDMYFDDVPIIWNNFSRAGYLTTWFDEMAGDGLFFFQSGRGFRQKPTDYFPRPLMLRMESLGLGYSTLCFGNTPVFQFMLDYLEKYVKSMRDTTFFAYISICRISHDDLNTPQAMDNNLREVLEGLYDNGDLNNTVLVIFGDHGMRFGEWRETLIGAVEDKTPFMSIYLPKRLRDRKPHLQTALVANSGRLLSAFDMYEMLMDIALDNMEKISRVRHWGLGFGHSPFRPLPVNRTCEEAGIPTEFCACLTPIDIDVADLAVLAAARQLVEHINVVLGEVPNRPCAELSLEKIQSAQVLTHGESLMLSRGFVELLRVAVRTMPGEAMLQGVVRRHAANPIGTVLGDVERINKYGNQSWCVASYPDARIKTYCFCAS